MFKLKFLWAGLLVFALYPYNVFAETDQSWLFPQDMDTMVSDCMLDGNKVILAQSNIRETIEKAVGKERASILINENNSETRKAMAECEARSPDEKVEIAKRYEREYGYKRPPSSSAATAGSGALDPGGILNPIHIIVH